METCLQNLQSDPPFIPIHSYETFGEKVRRGLFHSIRRHVEHHPDPDDRCAEALAVVWDFYRKKAEQGDIPDDALLVHAARLAALSYERRFASTGYGRRRDVMNPLCYFSGEVEVLRLDGADENEDGPCRSQQDPPAMSFVDNISYERSRDVEDQLISGFDLDHWLNEQTEDDRTLLAARYAGGSFEECGRAARMTISAAHHRLKRLGHELAECAQLTLSI